MVKRYVGVLVILWRLSEEAPLGRPFLEEKIVEEKIVEEKIVKQRGFERLDQHFSALSHYRDGDS